MKLFLKEQGISMSRKSTRASFSEIAVTVVCLFGIGILIFAGIKNLAANIEDIYKLRTYLQTEGTVIRNYKEEYKIVTRRGPYGTGGHTKTRTINTNTLEYCVDGTTYTLNGPAKIIGDKIGTKKTVFYNPQNPAESLVKGHVTDRWYSLLVLLLILIPAMFLFRWMFKLFFGGKKDTDTHSL